MCCCVTVCEAGILHQLSHTRDPTKAGLFIPNYFLKYYCSGLKECSVMVSIDYFLLKILTLNVFFFVFSNRSSRPGVAQISL